MTRTNRIEFTAAFTLRAGFDVVPGLTVTVRARGAKQGDLLTTEDGRMCTVSKGLVAEMVRRGEARRA